MPHIQSTIFDTRNLCPLGEGEGFVVVGDKNIPTDIIGLGFTTCPTEITGLVTQVIVNSIKAMALGPSAKVGVNVLRESREVINPISVNSNPSTPIPLVFRMVWIVATLTHIVKNRKKSMFCFGHDYPYTPRKVGLV
jgi:hypothetical protein